MIYLILSLRILKRNLISKNNIYNKYSLYYDKINLEERIKQGIKSTEINEKYSQIKNFYEKFIDVLNEKLVENTEQNMMIKFKLKELLESTHQNSANISSVQSLLDEEINDDEITRLNKEKKRYEESLSNESKEIEMNRTALHKNLKMTASNFYNI